MGAGITTRFDFSKQEAPVLHACVPPLSHVRQVGSHFTRATFPCPAESFWKGFCRHRAMHHFPADAQLPGNGTLSHTRPMQGQDFLIASNTLVPAHLLPSFDRC